ncbi:MAG TPA: MGMT family protein [Pseudonocardiaceae bacterium]
MTAPGFTIFATAIGHCGLAWGERGIVAAQLPEGSEERTRARMRRRCPDAAETAPPPVVRNTVDDIVALLGDVADGRGRPNLSAAELDMTGIPDFHRRVYEVARTIPPGRTLTYGDVAARLGAPGTARAVGQAMARNPFAPIVPCHRVLATDGRNGGFTAHGGVATKRRMLIIEGVLADEPTLF